MTPGDLLTQPGSGILLLLGAATLLATISALLPLRGGHGQHAHAGPGTLTVEYLNNERTPRAVPDNDPADTEITWPTTRDHHWLAPRHPSLVEEDLTELLHPTHTTDHIGRHRLDEPRALHRPPPDVHVHLPA